MEKVKVESMTNVEGDLSLTPPSSIVVTLASQVIRNLTAILLRDCL